VTIRKYPAWKDGIYDSEVEVSLTKYMMESFDEMLHQVIASYKGPDKVCLLKDKPKNVLDV